MVGLPDGMPDALSGDRVVVASAVPAVSGVLVSVAVWPLLGSPLG